MASLATDDNDTTTTTRRRTTTTEASELPHFEDLPGILQICSGIDTKPGIISYFDDDIHAVINMFAKTSTKFLEYEPLRQKYFKVFSLFSKIIHIRNSSSNYKSFYIHIWI